MGSPALRVLEGHALNYRRTWKGTAVTTFANPVLFLLAMGLGLGTLVDRGDGAAALEGLSYLEFLAPGLLAATTMQVAFNDSSWPVLVGIKWRRTYEAALATPVTVRDIVAGHLAWVVGRLVLTAVVFVVVMAAFGAAGLLGGLLAVAPAVLTGMAFAGVITAYASTLEDGQGLTAIMRFGIVPMFLFSGTFFPISQLPGFLQPVAAATPLWHGVELTRSAVLGLTPAWSPLVHAAYLLLWAGVGAVLAVHFLGRRMVQ
jgi:lipooligosaccharide transport system permease protein